MSRLIWVFMVAFFTIILTEAYWESGEAGHELGALGYLATSALSVLIYLPMLSWVARWLGLKIRTGSRALIITLAVIVLWCVGPIVLRYVLWDLLPWTRSTLFYFLLLLSPATIIIMAERVGEAHHYHLAHTFGVPAVVPICLNFALYGTVLYVFRRLCLTRADRYLGRLGAGHEAAAASGTGDGATGASPEGAGS